MTDPVPSDERPDDGRQSPCRLDVAGRWTLAAMFAGSYVGTTYYWLLSGRQPSIAEFLSAPFFVYGFVFLTWLGLMAMICTTLVACLPLYVVDMRRPGLLLRTAAFVVACGVWATWMVVVVKTVALVTSA